MTADIEAERARIVASMLTVLGRLALSRDLLTVDQRFETAELLRDVADCLDRGRVLAAHPTKMAWRPHRRLVRSHKTEDGQPLFRVVLC